MVSCKTLNEKLPIKAFSPFNVKENCLVTSSLLCSTLLVILTEKFSLTLLRLCLQIQQRCFVLLPFVFRLTLLTWWHPWFFDTSSFNDLSDAQMTVL